MLELPELEPLELDPFELDVESSEFELEEDDELFEFDVVPVLSEVECFAETTATDSPVPPMPRTAVAIAAAEARRSQRLRGA